MPCCDAVAAPRTVGHCGTSHLGLVELDDAITREGCPDSRPYRILVSVFVNQMMCFVTSAQTPCVLICRL